MWAQAAGIAMLEDTIRRRCTSAAIFNFKLLDGFGGTGFVAKGIVHTIIDADRDKHYFSLRADDFWHTGVGPNPRSLINIAYGRPASAHRYGGDDDFYMNAVRKVTDLLKQYIPSGAGGSFRRKYANVKVVQFNLCKLMIVLTYILTGKAGKHARRQSGEDAADEVSDESGEDAADEVSDDAEIRKRPSKRKA